MKDLQASEAWYAKRHIELVDFAWYFCVPPPVEKATIATTLADLEKAYEHG